MSKKQEYVAEKGYKEWIEEIKQLQQVDPRLNAQLIANLMGYRRSYINTILDEEHPLPMKAYEWWNNEFMPAIKNRIDEYREYDNESLARYLSQKWQKDLKKIKQTGILESNIIPIIENHRRKEMLRIYDAINNYLPYQQLPLKKVKIEASRTSSFNTRITKEAQEALNELDDMKVPTLVLQELLMPGENVFQMLLNNQHQSYLHRRLLKKVQVVLPQLQYYAKISREAYPSLGINVDIHKLTQQFNKSVEELSDDCAKHLNRPMFLKGRVGDYVKKLSRGKALMIIILEDYINKN